MASYFYTLKSIENHIILIVFIKTVIMRKIRNTLHFGVLKNPTISYYLDHALNLLQILIKFNEFFSYSFLNIYKRFEHNI